MSTYHVAQVNIGRVRAVLDDPQMAGFMNRLDEVNAIADNAPGFVWRLHGRKYVETVEALRNYVYGTAGGAHSGGGRSQKAAGAPGGARTERVCVYGADSGSAGRGVSAQYRLGLIRAVSGAG